MKKFFASVSLLVVMAIALPAIAKEKPKLLPEGVVVSAVVNKIDKTATVTITGIKLVKVEFYAYEEVKEIDPNTSFTVNIREGRRFNFSFKAEDGKAHFALLTPEMAAYPLSFFGPGIGMDCSSPDGCCFLIIGE